MNDEHKHHSVDFQSRISQHSAGRARQWAAGSCLAAAAALTAMVTSLATSPAARADDGDSAIITSIDQVISQYAGVADVSDIAPLQSSLSVEIAAEQATIADSASPTASDYMSQLSTEAQLTTVNSAVTYGNAEFLSQTDPTGFPDASAEIPILPSQIGFENDIQNFYTSLPSFASTEDTNSSLVSALDSALSYQNEISNTVVNLGGLDGLVGEQVDQLNADNLLLIDYDSALNNATGWVGEVVAFYNAL